jgi:CubicO group peptidase (beta-lactamase class C family)
MRVGPGGGGAVTPFNDRERPAGTKFSYASVETQVLGLVLTRATGRPVAEYLSRDAGGLTTGFTRRPSAAGDPGR